MKARDSTKATHEGHAADRLRWYRAVAWGFTISCIGYAAYGMWLNYAHPAGVDYVSFWAAAKLALQGTPALAYDLAAHRSLELSIAKFEGWLPFAYPPPFLLVLLPLGIPTLWLSFAFWVAVTGGLYALAVRALTKGPYALANPTAHLNVLYGQTGFFTTGLFIGGTAYLDRRPFVGGAILGLMCIKPQLSVLIPVALVAGRRWRALGAAAVSAILFLWAGAVAFGVESYRAFLGILPAMMDAVRTGNMPMNQLASVYALLRYFYFPEAICQTAHVAVAAVAAVSTWIAWTRDSDARVPILAASSLLISPYIYAYDTLLLTVPMIFLLVRGDGRAAATIWGLSLLSFVGLVTRLQIPNLLSIAAILALWALHRNAIAGRQTAPALAGQG